MTDPYARLARYYDLVFQNEAATEAELAFLRWAFETLAARPVRRVLDVAAGTGRHAIPLARAGFQVTAADRSAAMLDVLRAKAAGAEIATRQVAMQDLDLRGFDAVICMFTAFAYLIEDDEVRRALRAFRRAVEPGGLVVIDTINVQDLLGRFRPSDTTIHHGEGVVVQRTELRQYESYSGLWHHDEVGIVVEGDRVTGWGDRHTLRIHSQRELRAFLREAGFEAVRCYPDFTARSEATTNARRLIFVCTA